MSTGPALKLRLSLAGSTTLKNWAIPPSVGNSPMRPESKDFRPAKVPGSSPKNASKSAPNSAMKFAKFKLGRCVCQSKSKSGASKSNCTFGSKRANTASYSLQSIKSKSTSGIEINSSSSIPENRSMKSPTTPKITSTSRRFCKLSNTPSRPRSLRPNGSSNPGRLISGKLMLGTPGRLLLIDSTIAKICSLKSSANTKSKSRSVACSKPSSMNSDSSA